MPTIQETKTNFIEGMRFESHLHGHTITIDTDEAGGGTDAGPRPKALLLTSLGGCTGMDIVTILNKMRVQFSNLEINVKAEMTDEHPKVYTSIEIEYRIQLAQEDQASMIKAVDLSMEKYCGVSAMLAKVCPITHKIVFS